MLLSWKTLRVSFKHNGIEEDKTVGMLQPSVLRLSPLKRGLKNHANFYENSIGKFYRFLIWGPVIFGPPRFFDFSIRNFHYENQKIEFSKGDVILKTYIFQITTNGRHPLQWNVNF